MVSTQANTHLSPRRPKNKLRTKRTKRKLGRRTTPSDSKSSLENTEVQPPLPTSDVKPDDIALEPKIKKRSFSEERQTSRVKLGQRSSSLQLDSTQVLQPRLPQLARNQQSILSKRKAWFLSWPVRLAVPNRGTIDDEGFDSFHGNNSSSSDCENEENLHSNEVTNLNPNGIVGLSEKSASVEIVCPNGDPSSGSHVSHVSISNSGENPGNSRDLNILHFCDK